MRTKKECPVCKKLYSLSNFSRHSAVCSGPDEKITRYSFLGGVYACSECQFSTSSQHSINSHWWRAHTVDGQALKAGGKTKGSGWNRGLTKETDERVRKNAASLSKSIREKIKDGTRKPRIMGNKARQELSERQSLHNSGGRCKWFTVNGVSVQGTWERDIATKLSDLGISWMKVKTKEQCLKYDDGIKIRTYTPDFYLPDLDLFLEIKGYWWGNDKKKMELVYSQHPKVNIVLIQKEEYNKIMRGELVW